MKLGYKNIACIFMLTALLCGCSDTGTQSSGKSYGYSNTAQNSSSYSSGYSSTTGNNSGYSSGYSNTTGNNSGNSSGYSGTTGNNSGYSSGYSSTTQNNSDPLAKYTTPSQNSGASSYGSTNQNQGNAYGKGISGYGADDGTIDGFKFSNCEYMSGEHNSNFDSYLQLFTITVENASDTTKHLYAKEFYMRDPNGQVYNFSSYDFYHSELGPDVDRDFRPGQKTKFNVRKTFYQYETLVGSTLYYKDKEVFTF